MTTYQATFRWDGPFAQDDAMMLAWSFYKLNGYIPRDASALIGELAPSELVLERGERGKGWFSSDLTLLPCVVTLRLSPDHDAMTASYHVDTTGQILSEQERLFWEREAQAASELLKHGGKPQDRRTIERARARKQTQDNYAFGIQATIGVILTIVLGALILHSLGII